MLVCLISFYDSGELARGPLAERVTAAARRRDWAVELEAASARRRRAQEVSRQ